MKKILFLIFFLFSITLLSRVPNQSKNDISKDEIETYGKAGHVGFSAQIGTHSMIFDTSKGETWYYLDENFSLGHYDNLNLNLQLALTFFLTERFFYTFYSDTPISLYPNLNYKIVVTMGVLTSSLIRDNISIDLGIATRYNSYDFLVQFGATYYFIHSNEIYFGISNNFNLLLKRHFVLENIFSVKWQYIF